MRTCSAKDLDCVHHVSVDGDTCLERCQGTIADVIKLNNPVNVEALQETLQQYEQYKLPHSVNLTYPSSMKGNRVFYLPTSYNTTPDLQFRNKLKFVRISFSTSAFDRIQKVTEKSCVHVTFIILQDRAAKFVDQLSAIGGTMGLLTGFSLISGVEILYFFVKILLELTGRKLSRSKQNVKN